MVASCQVVLVTGSGSGVGKTSLGEKLALLLRGRGHCVAVVKHVHHGVDYRVKDTGRYLAAGASRVVAAGPEEYMVVEPRRLDPSEAVELASKGCSGEPCTVIVEGFRGLRGLAHGRGWCHAHLPGRGSVVVEAGGESMGPLSPGEAAELLADMAARGLCGGNR